MNIKSIISASAALIMSVMTLNAEPTHLTVELQSGSKYDFLLADKPVITFSSGDLVVNGDASTSYSIEGVKNFHFSNGEATNVESLSAGDISIISLDNATIQVKSLESSALVTLVNIYGSVMAAETANSEGVATIKLPETKGVYILTAAKKSFKVIRK